MAVLAATAFAAGCIGTGAGIAEADTGVACLWAGDGYRQGLTISAGGWNFTCRTDSGGGPYWAVDHAVNGHSTVHNPGANSNPAGLFSPGARQPGTSYNDFCVGSQLIEGAEDIYQAVADRNGAMYWKAAGSIDLWTFDGGTGPQRSWRSSSLCYDGVLS
ncbi:hypothetical protein [Nocardia australiensis]|uniref:hypothetical protein n=1 Tax=Nocardia australiensis TaxID=2887191 RepID=UPI001D15D62B|nr:hypothetical protein [Nocardia australiensis]